MSENSDIYEFKNSLFNNGDSEEFFFVRNFRITIKSSGTLDMDAKVQYFSTLIHVKSFHQFDNLSSVVKSTNPLTVEAIILGLGAYFFPVNSLSKKKRAMRRIMRKPRGLKVRCTRIV